MDARSVVDDWDTAPFDGGFGGIGALASRGFSGAIETGETWLFLRDGEPLAVVSDLESTPRRGDIDAFEDATGRRHEAPTPAAATLAAMLALDGEVRGRYFTDDTPLDAVDETLSEGGFTGYVELSENVLSGDYYYVYVDGEADRVAFVGSSRMLSGEEAESRATGEVGIYDVVAVRLPRPTLPEPEPEPGTDAGMTPVPESESESEAAPGTDGETAADGPTTGMPTDADSTTNVGEDNETDDPAPTERPATDAVHDGPSTTGVERSPSEDAAITATETGSDESPDGDGSAPGGGTPEPSPPGTDRGDDTAETAGETPPDDAAAAGFEPADEGAIADAGRTETPESDGKAGDEGAGGIEAVTTRTVPSLDPENSGRRDPENVGRAERERVETRDGSPTSRSPPTSVSRSGDSRAEAESDDPQIEAYESRIEELEAELADADSRIEELEAELESLRAERDDLQRRIGGSDDSASESLTPSAALAGTSLFVRERTRGDGTLEDAHAGDADRDDVESNLRIEYHTSFEDADALVDGDPFESWLRSSDTFAFVEWLTFELLFEIRSTSAVEELRPLYDALPEIDRIGFDETIPVGDGTEGRETTFDIVARNKRGKPLLAATFDRGRDPTRADAIEPLVVDASDVCADHDTLAAAVAITSSYFESDAMAAVEEATSTSLLSRSKHHSYVKLSRTNGFHLCLVEARDESFNLTVPEL